MQLLWGIGGLIGCSFLLSCVVRYILEIIFNTLADCLFGDGVDWVKYWA